MNNKIINMKAAAIGLLTGLWGWLLRLLAAGKKTVDKAADALNGGEGRPQ